jgi:hypothetical protein
MKLTKHAEARSRQRGFSSLSISLLQEYGRTTEAAGGAIKLSFGKKEAEVVRHELKKILQLIDKVNGSALILEGGTILTMYKC